ncbi:hypothetical protein ES708_20631 [subsurface metagenome]
MVTRVAVHITLGINLHHQADYNNDNEHHRRQGIHHQPQVNGNPSLNNHPAYIRHG